MSPEFNFTVDITGIFALLGVIWGFAKMSAKLDGLSATVKEVGNEIGKIVGVLASLSERVTVLEALDEEREREPRGRKK